VILCIWYNKKSLAYHTIKSHSDKDIQIPSIYCQLQCAKDGSMFHFTAALHAFL